MCQGNRAYFKAPGTRLDITRHQSLAFIESARRGGTGERTKADRRALSITRLEGSRWRGGQAMEPLAWIRPRFAVPTVATKPRVVAGDDHLLCCREGGRLMRLRIGLSNGERTYGGEGVLAHVNGPGSVSLLQSMKCPGADIEEPVRTR